MTLHVTNGDIVVDLLRRAGLATDALAWADVLHEGSVPGGLDDGGLRRVRAEFLAGADGADAAEVRRRFEERDRALAAGSGGEYLLWFEADLYDQLQIAQIVAGLRELGVAPGRVTLVCIGEYPGIAHFGGLGQLEPGQLPGLLGAATPLTAEALDLGAAAWAALRAPDPGGLGRAPPPPRPAFPGGAFRPPGPRVPLDAGRPVADRGAHPGRPPRRRRH